MENVTSVVQTITPSFAEGVLGEQEKLGVINRKVIPTVVDFYAKQMAAGQWRMNGQAIVFNGHRLLDGQHRLRAVVQAGASVQMLVVRGVPEDAFVTLDTGRKRQASDVLSIDGHTNVAVLAGATNLILQYLGLGSMYANTKTRYSTQEISVFANQHRIELNSAFDVGYLAKDIVGLPSLPVALAFLVRAHQRSAPFFQSVASGLNLTEADPVYQLRQRCIAEKANRVRRAKPIVKAAWLIKAWNAYATERPMALLRWRSDSESFPEIVGCLRP